MLTNFPNGVSSFGIPVIPAGLPAPYATGTCRIVDGSHVGDYLAGSLIYGTIQAAIDASGPGDVILVQPKLITDGDTDPGSYAETLVVDAEQENLSIIGLARGSSQGGRPQIRPGSGTAPIIEDNTGNLFVANLTFNGAGHTGGGIRLDSSNVAPLVDAFGVTVRNCLFKNLKGSGAAATGGAIYWGANGGAWYPVIEGNEFFDCRAGIVLTGTGISVPRMVTIRGNTFFASANTNVDADIYLAGGSGVNGLVVDNNVFGTVDVPAYATAPSAARYLDLTNCVNGVLSRNVFACTGKTFGAAGNAAKIPTTVRMAANWQEDAIITRT